MNIVDILKQQLGGEVSKTLGGMVGASEGDLSKILAAGLPSLLSGLGSIASSREGASKVADAIGGIDSGLLGNLAGMLSSPLASKGGTMLGGLFGAGMVDNIASSISKFTGVNQGIVKMALGYLTPIVLGVLGKAMGGARPDASSISQFFSEQKSNISAAAPAGFSINSIPGFNTLAGMSPTARQTSSAPASPSNSGGLGKLLVPAILLAAVAGMYFLWNNSRKQTDLLEKSAANVKETADKMLEEGSKAVGEAATKANDAFAAGLDAMAKIPSVDSAKESVTSIFDGLTNKLSEVTDASGAEAILPDLKDYSSKLDGLAKTMAALPEEGKSIVAELVKSQMASINAVLEKFTGIPNLAESVLQVIEQIKDRLKAILGS